MGIWAVGLYSNDLGMDIRDSVKGIMRLPVDDQQLINLAIKVFKETAENDKDEEYTTFWLVLADQFHYHGIHAKRVFDIALDIINSGRDLENHRELGMSEADIGKRKKVLIKLKNKLEQPIPIKPRKVIATPQPLIMSTGDVLVYPIDEYGHCINPYITERKQQKRKIKFVHQGWGIAVIISCGRLFDYFSYYIPIVTTKKMLSINRPTYGQIEILEGWRLARSGTCPDNHFKRMQIGVISKIKLDEKRLITQFSELDNGISTILSDISIANRLDITSDRLVKQKKYLQKLDQIKAID
jgi:hypothetical protein